MDLTNKRIDFLKSKIIEFRSDFIRSLKSEYISCCGYLHNFEDILAKDRGKSGYHFFKEVTCHKDYRTSYVLRFFSNGREEFIRHGIIRHLRMETVINNDTFVILLNPYNIDETPIVYLPHFFDRFKERFLQFRYNLDDITPKEVVNLYFLNNPSSKGFIPAPDIDTEHYAEIYSEVNSGREVGSVIDGIRFMRTFLDHSMRNYYQYDDESYSIYRECYENEMLTIENPDRPLCGNL